MAFLNSAQGQEIIAHNSFEYPIASGVSTAQPEAPLAQLQPNSITIPELGTGAEAIKLLRGSPASLTAGSPGLDDSVCCTQPHEQPLLSIPAARSVYFGGERVSRIA